MLLGFVNIIIVAILNIIVLRIGGILNDSASFAAQ